MVKRQTHKHNSSCTIDCTRKSRNLEYEKKFQSYLFSDNWEFQEGVAKNIGVVPSIPETIKAFQKWKSSNPRTGTGSKLI